MFFRETEIYTNFSFSSFSLYALLPDLHAVLEKRTAASIAANFSVESLTHLGFYGTILRALPLFRTYVPLT
jgi:hypothetical protein